jgi:hypothetical protein
MANTIGEITVISLGDCIVLLDTENNAAVVQRETVCSILGEYSHDLVARLCGA